MNVYFLDLLNQTKERKKNLCSIFSGGFNCLNTLSRIPDQDLYLKQTYNFKKGDMINNLGGIMKIFPLLDPEPLVTDTDFHPLYWSNSGEQKKFKLPENIWKRIKKSKIKIVVKEIEVNPRLEELFIQERIRTLYIFSGFRIGKNRYSLCCNFNLFRGIVKSQIHSVLSVHACEYEKRMLFCS
jgi:hypothetical protein